MRYLWGTLRTQRPSRFLGEIPQKHLERVRRPQAYTSSRSVKPVIKESSPQEDFAVGDTIFHQDFGVGKVKEVGQDSMGIKYKIYFVNDSSFRTLVGKYAQLKKL